MSKGKIIKSGAVDQINDGYMEYATYVLLERHIPDYRDGLKPVYRRILYTFFDNNTIKNTQKSSDVVGDVMRLHPHGDASTYETMVNMTQDLRNINPLLTGDGNFGFFTARDSLFAGGRYTNLRLSDYSHDLYFQNLNDEIVDYIESYSGVKYPSVLPSILPNGLLLAQEGMAVGYACKFASFNVNEVADQVINHLNGDKIQVLTPDFGTGGYILDDQEELERIHKTGRGTVKLRGKAEIDGNEINITEVPYGVKVEDIIDRVVELAKDDRLAEVADVQDLTGYKGVSIYVKAKKGTDMEFLLDKLYAYTKLEESYSVNMTFIKDQGIAEMGVEEYIQEWTEWRRETKARELTSNIKVLENKLYNLNALTKILPNIDKTITIIRKSEDMIKELMQEFDLEKDQAEYVARMRISLINEKEIEKQLEEIKDLQAQLDKLNSIVSSEERLNELLIEEIEEFTDEYGSERQTQILQSFSEVEDVVDIVETEQIEDKNVWVQLSELGYAYKTDTKSQSVNLRDNDKIIKKIQANNRHDVLVAFDIERNGNRINISEISEDKNGVYIPQIIEVGYTNIVDYMVISDMYKYVFFFFENGKVAKIDTESFNVGVNIFRNGYNSDMDLYRVDMLEDDREYTVTVGGKKIDFDTKDINSVKSRATNGVYLRRRGDVSYVSV